MTTCNHTLYAIVDVFAQYYDQLASTMLSEVYKILIICIRQENEQLATSAISCLENLVISVGDRFTEEMWENTVEQIVCIFKNSTIALYAIGL
jgi:brefeldin A-inhibited guanine nucleotide-exchange protein